MKKNLIDKMIQSPERLLLSLGLFFGLLFCIFIPTGAGFDEETHMVRIFDISGMHFVPNSGSYTFSEFYSLSYNRRYFQNPAWDQFSKPNISTKGNWDSMSDGSTRSKYNPINYIVQAITAGIVWRVLDLPIVIGVIAVRISGYLLYLLLCYLTIRNLPIGKWAFLVLSLNPMALFQASTLNIDGFTMGVSYLFVGYILKIFADKEKTIDLKRTLVIVLLTILVGCVKPGTFLLLPLLLILVKNKTWSKWSFWLILIAVLLSLFLSVGWLSIFNTKVSAGTTENSLGDQIVLVSKNLMDFIPMFFIGIIKSLGIYFRDWVGVYGYWVGKVPVLIYVFFPIALVLAVLAESRNRKFNLKNRIFLFIAALFSLVGIASYQFILHYQPFIQGGGAQGRYFLPFVPLFFLVFSGLILLSDPFSKLIRAGAVICLTITLVSYGFGIYRTYYTKCVFPVSSSKPCALPLYRNIDVINPYIVELNSSQQIRQGFIPQCSEITAFQLFVNSNVSDPKDEVILSVWNENNEMIASGTTFFSSIKKGDPFVIPLRIENIPEQSHLTMNLSLVSTNSMKSELGLLGREGAEIYPDGNLFINNFAQEGDLIFQYMCKNPN